MVIACVINLLQTVYADRHHARIIKYYFIMARMLNANVSPGHIETRINVSHVIKISIMISDMRDAWLRGSARRIRCIMVFTEYVIVSMATIRI